MSGPLIGFLQAVGSGNWDAATINLGVAVVVLLICFPLHELAHAVAADRLGDDTPRMFGRITLNPAAHLSLFGSIMFLMFGFGWATTPVNPSRLRGRQHISHALVALAGPAANFAIALIFGLALRLALTMGLAQGAGPVGLIFAQTATLAVIINFQLCLFNLIPIAPLDGWTILKGLAPWQWQQTLSGFERYMQYAWLLLLFVGGSLISRFIAEPAFTLSRLIIGM